MAVMAPKKPKNGGLQPIPDQPFDDGGSARVDQPSSPDPFAAMGGGVQIAGGGWVPKNHPLANQTPAAPAPSGSNPYPSLPPGAVPPPGYVDPVFANGGGPPAPAPAPDPAPAPATAPTPAPGAPAAPAPAPAAPETQPAPTVNTAYKDALLKMLTGNQADPSLNDPILKAQSDAYGAQQQRALEQNRAALAERMSLDGTPGVSSGAFDSDLTGMSERMGEARGAFDANLLGTELQNRRQQLIQAATLAGNQLNAEEARSLQRELANIDAEIRRAGLAQQGSQFDRSLGEQGRQFDADSELKRMGINLQGELGRGDLDLRRMLGSGQLNLGLLSALLQNQQYGQGLGAQIGMFNQTSNNSNIQALLNALGGAV